MILPDFDASSQLGGVATPRPHTPPLATSLSSGEFIIYDQGQIKHARGPGHICGCLTPAPPGREKKKSEGGKKNRGKLTKMCVATRCE